MAINLVQREVLDPASFTNANTNAADAVKVRVDAGSVVGNAIATAVGGATIAPASETVQGKIEIATQAETTTGSDDLRAITPLKLKTYVDARVASLPADRYVSSMASYDNATNVATFNLNGGGTTTADFTPIVNDAVASALTGKVAVNNNAGTLIGYLLAP